jgi:hypothetical protein
MPSDEQEEALENEIHVEIVDSEKEYTPMVVWASQRCG